MIVRIALITDKHIEKVRRESTTATNRERK
jgi:hypothetical protein